MKKFFMFVVAFISCFTNVHSANRDQLRELQAKIDQILQAAGPNVHVGIEIVSLKNGQKLYEKNAHHLFVPSSALKLFTAGAALNILGIDYCFETEVLSDAEVKNGILEGNLYLKGSGDPTLTTHDLENLIYQLKALQIETITGDLIIDNSDFDSLCQGPGWMWDEGSEYWNSPMDALTVNHSCVKLSIKSAEELAKPPAIFLEPNTDYVTVQNMAITGENEEELQVDRRWMTRENIIQVKGQIGLGAALVVYEVPVEAPYLYTAHLFRDLLAANGIQLKGTIVNKPALLEATSLASHSSPPLNVIVQTMMKYSDNMYSNCLFKKIGQIRYGSPGSWPKGGQSVREFLQNQAGLNISDLVLLDGSGLSRYNLVSPHQFTTFLTWSAHQYKFSPEFMSSLPVSGLDGSLKNRMNDATMKGKVRAKPGAMTGLTSLAGYVVTKEGEELAFCIMINGFIKPVKEYRKQIEDKVCALLVDFERS